MISQTLDLLSVGFVQTGLVAAAILGLMSGIIAPLIVMRRMSFAVHGTSELALMGASAALLLGFNVNAGAVIGSILAAILLALFDDSSSHHDSVVGVIMSFGLGLSVLFIYLYPGNSKAAFSLLTGQIVGVSSNSTWILGAIAVVVIGTVLVLFRQLLFTTVDPVMAAATGLNLKGYSVLFAIIVGLTAAQSVQIVGALLVMALLITPGAAACAVTSNPYVTVALSTVFALTAAVGGFVLSLAPGLPVSVFVTTVSFVIYLVCRLIGWQQKKALAKAE
ncbi:hypothetical protein HMPREF1219_01413 [Corynebacterium pyruviciproducens ATCC BAA-1742]|uniref:ABC 3 transport family protein n=1 Tax=Corynebacterium pyruviciproducens ATCC BAA-1742 TaxID=1125779 RepID=S2YXY7_9CORY|nr:metal ABC transporter permease [Corynebacterium pyruviciproducens]EPD69188.1 hypothetical protein HMPREF1219_01413 [Corynebacterium pyruviciproducens ATCC BAA-1742]